MREGMPKTIYRKDYLPSVFRIDHVDLHVDIHEGSTWVTSDLTLRTDHGPGHDLQLDGEGLALEAISLDGRELTETEFHYSGGVLTVSGAVDGSRLQTRVRVEPENNTSLEGLYRSRTMYCTQCEAQGFRKITFFIDRPDVLATFRVTIDADSHHCPVLLSNGNREAVVALESGRHRATWYDPWPKPCYLFALVAGDLECITDTFTTASGRVVDLNIHVEAKDLDYCGHAMDALKRAMSWDEQVYGLEYDLDLFNIVAVDDFNMGAMENKSLNIFNTSCVLASPDIMTDAGYLRIESIVAHEYFHNYSGNRVTCRDWFQLSLKEGFTVFRDAQFSADMNSPGVKRVEDVAFLRTHQFAEDAGPTAHPVRPDSFIEISNFYTLTVYEKGAEVVGMLYTLLGRELFLAGARHYFSTHDGQAVTCDDFVCAMEHVSGRDLAQFRRWYEQPGTPELTIEERFDAEAGCLHLTVRQNNPDATCGEARPPLHIPLVIGLISDGRLLPLPEGGTSRLLEVTQSEEVFTIDGLAAEPTLSPLQGFSAPVRLKARDDEQTLRTLIGSDGDDFVRWDAMQRYATQTVMAVMEGQKVPEAFVATYGKALESDTDDAMKSLLLTLPSEESLADHCAQTGGVDVFAIHNAREALKGALANSYAKVWQDFFASRAPRGPYRAEGGQIGNRALRHLALQHLLLQAPGEFGLAKQLLASADNLTDRLSALRGILWHGEPDERHQTLEDFYTAWQAEALVVNQWFTLQATRPGGEAVDAVLDLQQHPAFDWRNPNKVRALIGAFASGNPTGFHRSDGGGYTVLGDAVARLQEANPQIAARLCTPLVRYRRYAQGTDTMREQLERIAGLPGLSRDVFEVVNKALA